MEYENNNQNGELKGFDSADNGYTVTPNGGYYSTPNEGAVQDNITRPAQGVDNSAGYIPPQSYIPTPTPKKVKDKKRYGAGVVFVACILAAIIGAVSSFSVMIPVMLEQKNSVEASDEGDKPVNKVNINVDKTAANIVEAVADKATPSVVGIRTTTSVTNFFGGIQEASGDGSGVVYSSDGYIITNYHVIESALSGAESKIAVYLDSADSEGYSATVVGYNISADLAVIKINAKNLTAVEFSDSDKLKVGQYVITIGNPGGLEFMHSVTYGVISGLNRVVSANSDMELIQTDAAINPGNSGGALLDAEGKLVGINSSKIVSEEFEGMGFAIPSNTAKEICRNIIDRENEPEPYFGISISERYTADVLEYYGYPSGAVVLSVAEGSPAQRAGIRKGDIITEFGGKKITEYPILENEIMNSKPGDKITVKFYRSGRYYNVDVTIASNNAVD